MSPDEIWVAVPGYEGAYDVSSLGRVRSLPGGRRRGIVLKPRGMGRGYPGVALCVDGVIKNRYVHHMVAVAFIGPRPTGLDVCHNNGDFLDNRVENLRYDTVSGNMRDALAQGTHRSVSQTHCKQGHEFTPENLYPAKPRIGPDGHEKHKRVCRQCSIDAQRRYRGRNGMALVA